MAWTWTYVPVTSPASFDGCGMAFVGGNWVSMSFNDGYAVYATDPLGTWTPVATAAARWAGRMGNDGTTANAVSNIGGRAATTADGTSFTNNTGAPSLRASAFGNGVYVGVGSANVNAAVSANGTTGWSFYSTGSPSGGTYFDLAFAPTLGRFCAVNYANGGTAVCDDAGATWVFYAASLPWANPSQVVWSETLGLFVAMSENGHIATSPTGTNDWTDRGAISAGALEDGNWWNLVEHNGVLIAKHDTTSDAAISVDGGVSWSLVDTGDTSGNYYYGVASNGADTVVFASYNAVLVGIDGGGGGGLPLGVPHAITFEALDWSPDSQGEVSGALPHLRAQASQAANAALTTLPLLVVTASGTERRVGSATLALPRLRATGFQRSGGMASTRLSALLVRADELADPTPGYSTSAVTLPRLAATASGAGATVGTASLVLHPLRAAALEASGNFALTRLPALRAVGLETVALPENRFDLQQVGGYVYALVANPLAPEELTEALVISEEAVLNRRLELVAALTASASASLGQVANVTERLEVAEVLQHTAQLTITATEALLAQARAEIVFRYLLTESVLAADSASTTRRLLLTALEALEVSGLVESHLQARYILTEALVAHELALRGWRIDLTESLEFADAASAVRASVVALIEALVATDVASLSARFTLVLSEGLVAQDVATSTARFLEVLTEALTATAVFTLEGQEYVAWVFNAEGQAPASYYDFGFNSGAQYEGRTFVAMADGFYELIGDTDAGAPITAELVGGLGDFGSSLVKRMSMAYLHLTTDGELVMKFLVHMDGRREEHWYKLEGRMGDAVHPDRVKPDGGLESVTWGWKLTNLAGANFTIDRMRFVPMLTTRRI